MSTLRVSNIEAKADASAALGIIAGARLGWGQGSHLGSSAAIGSVAGATEMDWGLGGV